MRGETASLVDNKLISVTFQSTPLIRGETLLNVPRVVAQLEFQSTPLIRGETGSDRVSHECIGNFNPLPSYEGRQLHPDLHPDLGDISIHSPHTRGDKPYSKNLFTNPNFNPLPSYEGRRLRGALHRAPRRFQSTPLIRGETRLALSIPFVQTISIHSPHTRGDSARFSCLTTEQVFQSTPLTRGETGWTTPLQAARRNFNPLPSHEGRPHKIAVRRTTPEFQSTPLMRGETISVYSTYLSTKFQSTPLMRGETKPE